MVSRFRILSTIFVVLLLCGVSFGEVIVRQVSLSGDARTDVLDPLSILEDAIDMNMGCGVSGAFDIVFCIDSTGSMAPHLADVRAAIRGFCEAMDSVGYDFALGAVTYGDGQNYWDFDPSTPEIELTTDLDEFLVLLNRCGASGGGDGEETTLDAIYEAITLYNWRPFAIPIVIMFTDMHTCALDHPSYPHTGCCCWMATNVTSTQVLEAVLTTGAYVYNVFPHSVVRSRCSWSYDRYVGISEASGARTYELGVGFEDIFEDVIEHFADYASISLRLANESSSVIDFVAAELIVMDSLCVFPLVESVSSYAGLAPGSYVDIDWPTAIDSLCIGGDRCFNIVITSSEGHVDTVFGCTTTEDCRCIAPEGFVHLPAPDGVITACEEQSVIINIRGAIDEGTLDETTVHFSINDVDYSHGDPEISVIDSLITFTPSVAWEDNDTIFFSLMSISDLFGCHIETPIHGSFIVDLEPPQAINPNPPDGSTYFSDDFEVSFEVFDNLIGMDLEASHLTINGDRYELDDDLVSYVGDIHSGVVTVSGSAVSDLGFGTMDTAEICFHGVDLVSGDLCGPNEAVECFSWPIMLLTREVWFDEYQAAPCDTVLIPLWIDTTEYRLISSAEFSITFDPNVLVPIGLEFDGSLTEGWTGTYEVNPDLATFSASIAGPTLDAGLGGVFVWVRAYVPCAARGGDFCALVINDFSFNDGSPMCNYNNGIFIATWNIQNWLANLRINKVVDPIRTLELAIGATEHTTDNYEPDFDLVIFPPTPDFVNAWLTINDPDYPHITALRRDMRGMEPPVRWVIKSMGAPEAADIRWNPSSLPDGVFLLNSVIDMKIDTIAYFTVGDSVVIEWMTPDFATSNTPMCAGWNLTSLPTVPPSMVPRVVFPFSPVGAFSYNTQLRRYEEVNRFRSGSGYWVFASEETEARVGGIPLESYNLNLYRGWNIIGALVEPVDVSDFCTSIPDVIVGDIYGYDCLEARYVPATVLEPGRGYWLLALNDAVLSVPTGSSMYCRPFLGLSTPLWDFKVNIDGEVFVLGYSPDADVSLDAMDIAMPPLAPDESLHEKAFISRDGFMLRRDISPIASWILQVPNNAVITFDIPAGLDNLRIELPGGDIALDNSTRLSSLEGGLYRIYIDQAPTHFELVGAYPNPFNSTVAISWVMPERGNVTVEVFDVLGNKVATILDGSVAAGKNTVVWDADGHISGVYFFSIKTRDGIKSGSVTFLK